MRRVLCVLAVVAGLVGGAALPAHAGREPFSCSGIPDTETHFCIVDSTGGVDHETTEEDFTIPAVCIVLDICTDPVTQSVPWVTAGPMPGWWLILWHDDTCYYFYPDATYTTYHSEATNGCP